MNPLSVFSNNLGRLISFAEEKNIKKILVIESSNQAWVSGTRINGSILSIDLANKYVKYYTPALEYWRAESKISRLSLIKDFSVEVYAYLRYKIDLPENIRVFEGGYSEVLSKEISDCANRENYCATDSYPQELRSFSEKLIDFKGYIADLRAVKSNEEIEFINRATEITMRALEKVVSEGVVGSSERILAGKLSYYIRLFGGDQEAFPLIVASNESSAYPHAEPRSRVIETGDLVLFDVGTRYSEYNSDMTRIAVNNYSYSRYREIIEAVEEAVNRSIERIDVGVKASLVDNIARETLARRGLAKYFIHSLGHGVGIDVHEKPYLSSNSNDVLDKNMVVTIEPGVYIRDLVGVRIEDLVVISSRGPRILTSMKRVLEY